MDSMERIAVALERIADSLSPKEKPEPSEPKRKATVYSPDFEAFWEAYPRRVGKAGAWRAWKVCKASLPPIDDLLSIIDAHANGAKWQEKDGQFIPHPATWLNQHRWEDDLPESAIPSKSRAMTPEEEAAHDLFLKGQQ